MTRDILAAIDEACDDWTVSKDAMRQAPASALDQRWTNAEPSVIASEMVASYLVRPVELPSERMAGLMGYYAIGCLIREPSVPFYVGSLP